MLPENPEVRSVMPATVSLGDGRLVFDTNSVRENLRELAI